jgi:hypothetical protein
MRDLVLVIVAAALLAAACIDGELGTVSAKATMQTDVHITPDAPVAVRHLTFGSTPVMDAEGAGITIRATRIRADDRYEMPDGVSVSVRPDDPTLVVIQQGHPDESLPGAKLSFAQACHHGCTGGVIVVVRSAPADSTSEDVRILSEMLVVSPSKDRKSLDATPSIAEDVDRRFDGKPATALAATTSTIVVSSESPLAHLDLRIHADSRTIGNSRAYPLVGSLTLRGVGDGATHAALSSYLASAIGFVKVGNSGASLASEGNPADLDWRALCPATGDCDVTIGVDFSYDSIASSARVNAAVANESSPSIPRTFRLDLQAAASLVAFDGRSLDAESVKLTATEVKR